jgi:hypothetical protein
LERDKYGIHPHVLNRRMIKMVSNLKYIGQENPNAKVKCPECPEKNTARKAIQTR